MRYLIENSVFAAHPSADPQSLYVRDYLREAVEHLTFIKARPDTIIDRLTFELLALHKANPFRDPVDEAALSDDLASIRAVQVRVNNLVEWLEKGTERGLCAEEG